MIYNDLVTLKPLPDIISIILFIVEPGDGALRYDFKLSCLFMALNDRRMKEYLRKMYNWQLMEEDNGSGL